MAKSSVRKRREESQYWPKLHELCHTGPNCVKVGPLRHRRLLIQGILHDSVVVGALKASTALGGTPGQKACRLPVRETGIDNAQRQRTG
jgi:hypothetical protein